jgi:hypothetical protein
MKNYVTLWLSNGKRIKGEYFAEDFDGIYEDWEKGQVMAFLNCCVRGKDVIGMEYVETPEDDGATSIKPAPQDITTGNYEIFRDSSYYDMWCVRNTNDNRFESPTSFHFVHCKDATEFKRLIELAK